MELKRKPSGIYFIDLEVAGPDGQPARSRISFNTRDEREAKAQMRQWAMGVHPKQRMVPSPPREGLVSAPKEPQGWTVAKALARCEETVWRNVRAQASLQSNVKIVTALVGGELVEEMDWDRIERLIAQLEKAPFSYSPGTIKRKLDVLSKAVSMSTVWKDPKTGRPYLQGKPKWPPIKVQNEREREVLPHEDALIFAAIDARLLKEPKRRWWEFKALATILLETGFRLGEALVLDDAHVVNRPVINAEGTASTLPMFRLEAHETKGSRSREVPIGANAAALRPTLSEKSGGGRWFPWAPKSSTPWKMWDDIRSDLKKAGHNIDDVWLHTFRHTCANRLRRAGMTLEVLQRWLGHKDISITASRYTHVNAADMAIEAGIMSNGGNSTKPQKDRGAFVIHDPHVSGTNRASPGAVLN